MRLLSRRLIICASLVASLIVAPLEPMSVSAAPKHLSGKSFTPVAALFNTPGKSAGRAKNYAIISYINRAIDSTVKGSTIRISMYSIGIDGSANALINAHKRGVNVQFVTDDHSSNDQTKKLKKALSKRATKGQTSFFKVCDYSCTSDHHYTTRDGRDMRSFNHAKFFLFSSTSKDSDKDTSKVSIVTSSNLTTTQAESGWNNAYTIYPTATNHDNEAIYDFLAGKFKLMAQDKNVKNPYDELTSGKYKAYFFPRLPGKANDSSTDTYQGILDNVRCSGVTGNYGYADGKTRKTAIRIAMYSWTNNRITLANKLWKLNNDGCDVKVVVSKSQVDPDVLAALLRPTKSGRGAIEVSNAEISGRYVHNKYLTINGKYADNSGTKLVFTGSGNFTRTSLRYNNEILLRVQDDTVYSAYLDNFNAVSKAAKALRYVDPK